MKLQKGDASARQTRGEELMRAVRDGESAALIINTRSRFGDALLCRLRAGLEARGVHVAEAYAIRHPTALREPSCAGATPLSPYRGRRRGWYLHLDRR